MDVAHTVWHGICSGPQAAVLSAGTVDGMHSTMACDPHKPQPDPPHGGLPFPLLGCMLAAFPRHSGFHVLSVPVGRQAARAPEVV